MKEKYFKGYRIDSARLKTWNYNQNGHYFVTICTQHHEHYFGQINNSEVFLNKIGQIAKLFWKQIPEHYPFVNLDAFIIMPNHIHGIIIINKPEHNVVVETGYIPSLQQQQQQQQQQQTNSLGDVIGGFKAAVTRWCNKNNYQYFSWQPRYYDRIIRNERELFKIRKYIIYNPNKWEDDKHIL